MKVVKSLHDHDNLNTPLFRLYEKYNKHIKDIGSVSNFLGINNELKHANGRMSTVIIKTNYHGKSIGFFVEGVDDNGCIVPNTKFHKDFKGSRTAYSLNWFLYEILADFYFVCDFAAIIIKDILDSKGI